MRTKKPAQKAGDSHVTVNKLRRKRAPVQVSSTRPCPVEMWACWCGNSVYKQLEAAADGVVDMKLDDTSDPPRNLIRIRAMRNLRFDGRWREIAYGKNLDITIKQ